MSASNLNEIAKLESDGRIKLTAKSSAPESDGYDLVLISGLPYHAHPVATTALWAMLQQAIADETAFVVPWVDSVTNDQRREQKRAAINFTYEQATNIFKDRYPRTEMDGWSEQVRSLDAYDADPAAANTLIDILAQQNGRTRAQMAEAIRMARDRFVYAYAQLTGLRQKLENDLDAIDLNAADASNLVSQINEAQLTTLAQQLKQQAGN